MFKLVSSIIAPVLMFFQASGFFSEWESIILQMAAIILFIAIIVPEIKERLNKNRYKKETDALWHPFKI